MSERGASHPTVAETAFLLLAWAGLYGLYEAVQRGLEGWIGPADWFLPWSLFALVLWHLPRRTTRVPPLTTPGWPRALGVVWLGLLVLAALGVDHGGLGERLTGPALTLYEPLPLVLTLLAVGAIVRERLRASGGFAPMGEGRGEAR